MYCLRKRRKVILCCVFFTLICYLLLNESYVSEIAINDIQSLHIGNLPLQRNAHEQLKSFNPEEVNTISEVKDFYFKRSNQDDESKRLALYGLQTITQKAFDIVQNPTNCSSAKKLLCDLGQLGNGLGSKFHQVVHCHFIAFSLKRILYLKGFKLDEGAGAIELFIKQYSHRCSPYKPKDEGLTIKAPSLWQNTKEIDNSPKVLVYRHLLRWVKGPFPSSLAGSIPKSMATILEDIHYEPSLWYIGQSVSFLFGRPLPYYNIRLHTLRNDNNMVSPYIGIHIRHGDKVVKESKFIKSIKYLESAQQYLNEIPYILHSNKTLKPIYLASDDPLALYELTKSNNKPYHITSFHHVTNDASRLQHGGTYTYEQMRGTLDDIFLLSNAYAVICTFTSNIGRLIYELRQSTVPEYVHTRHNIISMDKKWYFGTSGYEHYPGKIQGYAHKDCNHGNNLKMVPCYYGEWFLVDKKDFDKAKSTPERLVNITSNNSHHLLSIDDVVWVDGESEQLDKVYNSLGLL